jgi:hypothetical protein
VRALRVAVALCLASCGGFLPFSGDDDEDDAPPPTAPVVADAAADGSDDAADASDDIAVGQDGGFCIPSKQCADDEFQCCSGQRGTGCTMKCEITCCS